MGSEGRNYSRSRGLKARIQDLISSDEDAMVALSNTLTAIKMLPKSGWQERISNKNPNGLAEKFFTLTRKQVYARNKHSNGHYDIETTTYPPIDNLADLITNNITKLKKVSTVPTRKKLWP